MKILIDINHPAHVHYFRNFIKIMERKGHTFYVISRNKEIEHYLLKAYDIEYTSRGKGKNNFLGKFLYLFTGTYNVLRVAKKNKIDLFLSFSSPYNAIASRLYIKPNISFDDTEHNILNQKIYVPSSKSILTPSSYTKNLGKKQIRFNGYMELCYLHTNYFKPDISVLKLLGVKKDEKYIILRFVSWHASHDVGQSGLSLSMKHKLVNKLSEHAKVFISSEGELPDNLKKYQIKIPPEKMHDALAFASMFVGEGATMASECAMLGTPAIYVNSLNAGTLEELEKLGMLYGFRASKGVLEKVIELLTIPNLKQEFQKRRQKMLVDKIDVTAFMVWFIEHYPESAKIMKENPDYQYRFK